MLMKTTERFAEEGASRLPGTFIGIDRGTSTSKNRHLRRKQRRDFCFHIFNHCFFIDHIFSKKIGAYF